MSSTILHTRSFIATAALPAYVRVKFDTANQVVIADAENAIGVTEAPVAAGAPVSVRLFNSAGSAIMTASAAIAAHSAVRATAAGKIDDSGTGPIVGYAAEAATGDGSNIEVLLTGTINVPSADTLTALTFTAGGATGAEVGALRNAVLALLKGAGISV